MLTWVVCTSNWIRKAPLPGFPSAVPNVTPPLPPKPKAVSLGRLALTRPGTKVTVPLGVPIRPPKSSAKSPSAWYKRGDSTLPPGTVVVVGGSVVEVVVVGGSVTTTDSLGSLHAPATASLSASPE